MRSTSSPVPPLLVALFALFGCDDDEREESEDDDPVPEVLEFELILEPVEDDPLVDEDCAEEDGDDIGIIDGDDSTSVESLSDDPCHQRFFVALVFLMPAQVARPEFIDVTRRAFSFVSQLIRKIPSSLNPLLSNAFVSILKSNGVVSPG